MGVVRGVEEEQTGAGGDEGGEAVEVGAEAGGAQGEGDAVPARERDPGGVRVVVRLEGDDLVARFDEGEERRGDRLGRSRRDEHLGAGVQRDAVEAVLVGGDRLTQFGNAGARRVLVAAPFADRADRRLADLLGAVRVGEALAQVDRSRTGGEGGHLGEDRRAEGGEARGEQGAAGGRGLGGHGVILRRSSGLAQACFERRAHRAIPLQRRNGGRPGGGGRGNKGGRTWR